MKRYILFSAFLSVALLASCTRERLLMDKERDALQERINAATQLDVKYSVDGQQTESLNYDNRAQDVRIQVNINDSSLVWNVESDRQWCEVIPEKHKGPGSFTLSVKANENFESREQATLTFVAGDYRGSVITVKQDGGSFLLSQPYFVMNKNGGSFTVNVTVQKEGGVEPEWKMDCDSWYSATKGVIVRQDEKSLTRAVNVSCQANGTGTRLGKVALSLKGQVTRDGIYVTQFGTEYNYDTDGHIFFGKDEKAQIIFTAPDKTIASLEMPYYASYIVDDNRDGTVQVTVNAEDNLSDCSEKRLSQVSLVLSNTVASKVEVPGFVQDYIPAHGLLTGKGLVKFAATIAAGEPTSDWEKDGVVNVLGDIDMKDITGWTGIGTAEHPFSGIFLGNGHTIDNLTKTEAGLFNVCSGATISKINLGKGCNIYHSTQFSNEVALGGIVSKCSGSEISSCTFSGSLEFASANNSKCNTYVGAIVGKADAESIVMSGKFDGNLTFSSAQNAELTANIGGVAGFNSGQTSSCESSGQIIILTDAAHLFAGGILPVLSADAKAQSNAFSGGILLSGKSVENAVGGLYGSVSGTHTFDFTTDKSVILGNFTIENFGGTADASLFVGGMIGRIEPKHEITVSGYDCRSTFVVDHSDKLLTAGYLCVGGAIGGCNPSGTATGSVKLRNVTNYGAITEPCNNSIGTGVSKEYLGGIAGYIKGKGEFYGCLNTAILGDATTNDRMARNDNMQHIVAGIVSSVEGASLSIDKCSNEGKIFSVTYNNYDYQKSTMDIQAGIIGSFGNIDTYTKSTSVTISGCSAKGIIQGFRGITAGLVGYAENATISNCTVSADFSGTTMKGVTKQANNSPDKAGIAGMLNNAQINDCTVKSSFYAGNPGGKIATGAGILAISKGTVGIKNCAWYGIITTNGTPVVGGVAANVVSGSLEVTDCKYGGTLSDTIINANNVEKYAVGSGTATVKGLTYWNGN